MWWILAVVLIALIVLGNIFLGMPLRDRIDVALEIVRTSRFHEADGIHEATREDPGLVGWLKAESDCVMLFRTITGDDTEEILDIASPSLRPSLVLHYSNGKARSADSKKITDSRARNVANQLLREARQLVALKKSAEDFGFRE